MAKFLKNFSSSSNAKVRDVSQPQHAPMAGTQASLHVAPSNLLTADGSPTNLGITMEHPKFPQYAVLSVRLETFKKWPPYLEQRPEVLAEAGFVFGGNGDSVRCYHCGGGLRNWDSEDDPWFEHAKWYPNCAHMKLVKGQAYIDQVVAGELPEEDTAAASNVADATGRAEASSRPDPSLDPMQSVAAQTALEWCSNPNKVRKAVELLIKQGKKNFTGVQVVEVVEWLEDKDKVPPLPLQAEEDSDDDDEGAAAPRNRIPAPEIALHKDKEEEKIKNDEEAERLAEENERLREHTMCKVCLDETACVIFLPCGHMVTCPQCAPAMLKCPICRVRIKGTVKAYLA